MEIFFADAKDTRQIIDMRLEYLREDGVDRGKESQIAEQLGRFIPENIGKRLFCVLAREGEKPCAAAMLLISEKPAGASFPNGMTAEILSVITMPKYRRQGIAFSMLCMLIEKARELDVSFIDLKATADGYPLYRKLGFESTGGHYESMRLKLDR